ncbi:MAG TPA: N-6 DNA methylase [Tepidisphaeraceae bacterium]
MPLFGAARPNQHEGDLAVLLDGRRSSLAFYSPEDPKELIYGIEPLSWSWSANVRHSLIANKKAGTLIHRRWDAPDTSTKFQLPRTPADATQVFRKIETMRGGQHGDVIGRLLSAFRRVRANLASHTADPLIAIRVFNAFLVGTERVRYGELSESDWLACRTVGDAMLHVPADSNTGIELLPESVRDIPIGGLLSDFVGPDPDTECWLEPDLLIRHASGILYQEAHFELEREAQSYLPGLAQEAKTKPGSREARFTPPQLARAMVQRALAAYGSSLTTARDDLVILDPACGSAIFLQHALQEIAGSHPNRAIKLVGFDTSPVSCAISTFCLGRARRDAVAQGVNVSVEIFERDALKHDWPSTHVILTNPPFAAWNKMSATDRESVVKSLGPLFKGHPDKAMAFVWKSVESIQPGGVLACIMPSPFLESSAGSKWRTAILEKAVISLIGRFRGYSFFQNAMVEPAFIVLKRKAHAGEATTPVTILVAQDGGEDESLRALRRGQQTEPEDESFSIFIASGNSINAANWLPPSQKAAGLINQLDRSAIPRVGELFKVHQGVRTGSNRAFILSATELQSLPEPERSFFRPAAGTSTIREARLFDEEYVFFPYGADGSVILPTLDELQLRVPQYYDRWLAPQQSVLAARKKVDPSLWWLLTWERQWQAGNVPKILSAYFGDRGSFGYDKDGRFVVVQGWGWLWLRDEDQPDAADTNDEDEDDSSEPEVKRSFYLTDLPWAYIAILNSSVFELLLSIFCPRVQGGQFHLSSQYIKNIFLPDLTDEHAAIADDIHALEMAGRALSLGDPVDLRSTDKLTANVYGIPMSEWDRAKKRG